MELYDSNINALDILETLDLKQYPTILNEINLEYDFFSELIVTESNYLNGKYTLEYYIINNDTFLANVDKKIFQKLDGYNKKNKNIYIKKISSDTQLQFNLKRKNNPFLSLENFTMPEFSLKTGEDYSFFFDHTDLFDLLFQPGPSFILFYTYKYRMQRSPNGGMVHNLRKDEPIIYYSKEDNLYIISNSNSKKIIFNKFIHINIELFTHYFKVFEKWLTISIK